MMTLKTLKLKRVLMTGLVGTLPLFLSSCKYDSDSFHKKLEVEVPGALVDKYGMRSGDAKDPYVNGQKINESIQKRGAVDMPSPQVEKNVKRESIAPKDLGGKSAEFSFSQMPLPTFIKTVFGDYLGVDFYMSPSIASRSEPVTLRTSGKRSPKELYETTVQILKRFGIQVVFKDGLYNINPSPELEANIPLIIRSRSSDQLPEAMRPVFQIVDIKYVSKSTVKEYLDKAYEGKLDAIEETEAGNSIILLGSPAPVKAAIESIQVFDQPAFINRKSVRINLGFITAEKLSAKLTEILKAEGYSVTDTVEDDEVAAITLLPVPSLNAVLAFAPDEAAVNHIMDWTKQLDNPAVTDPNGGLYYIPVRNTSAVEVGKVVNEILADQSLSSLRRRSIGRRAGEADKASSGKIVVDEMRNSLVFRGTAEEYGQMIPLIQSMDVPVRDVLVEIVIAEYNRNGSLNFGVEWAGEKGERVRNLLRDDKGAPIQVKNNADKLVNVFGPGKNRFQGSQGFGDLGSFAALSKGLNLSILRTATERYAVLHALETSNKSTILSNPRLLTRSGGEASYKVGSRVPTISQRAPNDQNLEDKGRSSIVESIKYEDVGVLLKIKPTIHAGRRIEVSVTQEVSSIAPDTTVKTTPTFNKLELVTNLSLEDGATVLMGGFIKADKRNVAEGVPILRDIPLLGHLFRTDAESVQKAENILLITPYIIDNEEDADAITRAFRDRMSGWLKWSPRAQDVKGNAVPAAPKEPIALTPAAPAA